jgi:hypothetical protein
MGRTCLLGSSPHWAGVSLNFLKPTPYPPHTTCDWCIFNRGDCGDCGEACRGPAARAVNGAACDTAGTSSRCRGSILRRGYHPHKDALKVCLKPHVQSSQNTPGSVCCIYRGHCGSRHLKKKTTQSNKHNGTTNATHLTAQAQKAKQAHAPTSRAWHSAKNSPVPVICLCRVHSLQPRCPHGLLQVKRVVLIRPRLWRLWRESKEVWIDLVAGSVQ